MELKASLFFVVRVLRSQTSLHLNLLKVVCIVEFKLLLFLMQSSSAHCDIQGSSSYNDETVPIVTRKSSLLRPVSANCDMKDSSS